MPRQAVPAKRRCPASTCGASWRERGDPSARRIKEFELAASESLAGVSAWTTEVSDRGTQLPVVQPRVRQLNQMHDHFAGIHTGCLTGPYRPAASMRSAGRLGNDRPVIREFPFDESTIRQQRQLALRECARSVVGDEILVDALGNDHFAINENIGREWERDMVRRLQDFLSRTKTPTQNV